MDLWKEMGLSNKRVLVVHHDDLGLLHAKNSAFFSLGYATGSIIVPTGWVSQLVDLKNSDLGVHLALTSELKYPRYRPLTGGASLRDSQGYMWQTVELAWENIKTGEAEAEMRAQIEAAFSLGFDVTHVDIHMGAALRPDLAEAYHRLALEYRLPALVPTIKSLSELDIKDPDMLSLISEFLEATPFPMFDIIETYNIPPGERLQWYKDTLGGLGPGAYMLIHHAAERTAESVALPDWRIREADFNDLGNDAVRRVLDEFHQVTFREIRDSLRRFI